MWSLSAVCVPNAETVTYQKLKRLLQIELLQSSPG